jgi:hypothetical protein
MEAAKAFLGFWGRLIFFFMALGLAAPIWAQTTVNASWTDSTGNWTTPSKWSCNCIPNNSSANVFNVNIPTGEVHLDNTSSPSTITVNSLSSNGLLILRGAAEAPPTLLKVSGLAPSTITSFYVVEPNAALEFAGGGITQIAPGGSLQLSGNGYAELSGATGSNSAVTGLKIIASNGSLELAHGASLSTTGGITNSGGLDVAQGSTLHVGGDLTMSGGSTLDIGGYYDMTSPATVTVAGTFSNETVPMFASEAGLAMVGGTVGGAPALLNVSGAAPDTLTGIYDLRGYASGAAVEYGSGGITQIGAASVLLDGSNTFMELSSATGSDSALASLNTISERGELDLVSGTSLTTGGTLTNMGTLELGGYDGYLGGFQNTLTTGGTVTNSGTIIILGGTNTLKVGADGTYVQAAGSTDVDGTLMGPIVHITGGTLFGSGVINGNVVNDGTVSPVDVPFRNTTLTTNGNYAQDADGTLVIDIWGGNHFDVLNVSGRASLDGTVDFDFLNGYVPGSNADFAFLKAGSVEGNFLALDFVGIKCPTCTLKLSLGILSLDTGSNPPTITSEPGTLILFGTSLLGLAILLRQQQCLAAHVAQLAQRAAPNAFASSSRAVKPGGC